MKKKLVLKLAYDISHANDMQIDLMKACMMAGMDDATKAIASFEVLIEDEEAIARDMRRQVQAEFREQDSQ